MLPGATSTPNTSSSSTPSSPSTSFIQHGSDYDVFGCGGSSRSDSQPDESNVVGSGASRIARYEAMSGSPSYGSGGLDAGFIVTKTDWTGKSPVDSPIARFPNEVLIHVLSFLEPQALLWASLISRRFHALVNSPQAWRSAFVRYFPSPFPELDDKEGSWSNDKRSFTRLSMPEPGENAWRKEYIQRTRLLRSLSKGKVQTSGMASKRSSGGLMVTYSARTAAVSVTHMVASFAPGRLRCMHASSSSLFVSASNPATGKNEKPPPIPGGIAAAVPDLRSIRYDVREYAVAVDMNVNRVMDLSEELGWTIGENCPDGKVCVHPYSSPYPAHDSMLWTIRPEAHHGVKPCVTALWIAKKRFGGVYETTNQNAAIVIGNSRGFVRIFTIAFSKSGNNVLPVKEFCISPGIPIVEIKVDEDFSPRGVRQKRPWIMVINALGEVYYLRTCSPALATVKDWKMIPQTVRGNPTKLYDDLTARISKSNWQVEEKALLLKADYHVIKALWETPCRMDWFLEVDWAGQNIITGRTGSKSYWTNLEVEKADTPIKHFFVLHSTRPSPPATDIILPEISTPSIFGESEPVTPNVGVSPDAPVESDVWSVSELSLPTDLFTRITAHALDVSNLARASSMDSATPVPGGNARLFAIGTNTGSIHIFNIRPTHLPPAMEQPICTINTASPQITTLALTSLLCVHGGDDGLVQAWDPLNSTTSPVRTLHSRFSAKARRRIEQSGGSTTDNVAAAHCLQLDPDPTVLRGIVALGDVVRFWSFSNTNIGKRKKSGSSTPKGGKRSVRASSEKWKQVIKGEQEGMKRERERKAKEKMLLEKRYGVGSGAEAMTEEEMVVYAAMLSREEFEKEAASRTVTPEKEEEEEAVDEDAALAEALRVSMLAEELEREPAQHDWSAKVVYKTPKGKGKGRARSSPMQNSFEDDIDLAIRLSLQEQ